MAFTYVVTEIGLKTCPVSIRVNMKIKEVLRVQISYKSI